MADAIYDELTGIGGSCTIVGAMDMTRRRIIPEGTLFEDLLQPIFRKGKCVYSAPPIAAVRSYAQTQLSGFHPGIRRFINPHEYPVGLERNLFDLRTNLILQARGLGNRDAALAVYPT